MATEDTYETRGVVVTDGLGVTVGLQGRVGLDNLLLKGTSVGTLGSLGLGRLMSKRCNYRETFVLKDVLLTMG